MSSNNTISVVNNQSNNPSKKLLDHSNLVVIGTQSRLSQKDSTQQQASNAADQIDGHNTSIRGATMMSKDTDKLAEDSIYSANNETNTNGLKLVDRSRNTNDSKR